VTGSAWWQEGRADERMAQVCAALGVDKAAQTTTSI
jgi:hypothetical protein